MHIINKWERAASRLEAEDISLKVLDEIVGDAVWVCEEELNKEQMTIDEAFKSNKEGFERGQSQLAAKLNELKE